MSECRRRLRRLEQRMDAKDAAARRASPFGGLTFEEMTERVCDLYADGWGDPAGLALIRRAREGDEGAVAALWRQLEADTAARAAAQAEREGRV